MKKNILNRFFEQSTHLYGFTLAESIVALTVLGIVAALTIPTVVRRQIEATNRTKIKKIYGYIAELYLCLENVKSIV